MSGTTCTDRTGSQAQPGEARQHRIIDIVVAIACYPLVVLLTLAPGGLEDGEDAGLTPGAASGLAFRLLPDLLPQGSEGLLAMVDHWTVGLLVFVGVPGLTVWAILYRRTKPRRLLVVSVVLLVLFANIVPIAVALYSYAAWFDDRRRLAAWTAAAVAALALGTGTGGDAGEGWAALTGYLVAVVIPLSLGLWMGTRRQLMASLRERADRLEREQQLLAERARIGERARIAREMHDVVAHRVSLMVLQAGGLEVSAVEPVVTEAAGHIRDTGREALIELRGILGVLRDETDGAPTTPQPVLADLERLVEDWRRAGMTVRYEQTGTRRPVPAPLERTAYRVVQEALTNASKHAPNNPVHIRLDYRRHELAVTVHNSLATAVHEPPASGYGLAGLRERVALTGGTLDAGALRDGTWQVHATLPTGSPAGAGQTSGTPREERT